MFGNILLLSFPEAFQTKRNDYKIFFFFYLVYVRAKLFILGSSPVSVCTLVLGPRDF